MMVSRLVMSHAGAATCVMLLHPMVRGVMRHGLRGRRRIGARVRRGGTLRHSGRSGKSEGGNGCD